MYARIDTDTTKVAETITHNPEGRYHPSLQWVEVPEWMEPFINNQFWYDGEALQEPATDYILHVVKAKQKAAFAATFATIEERAQRPQSSVLAALIDASPVPEPDADYIWQLEDIKATNRELLAQLEACTDWEEVQQIEPWLPAVQTSGLKVG